MKRHIISALLLCTTVIAAQGQQKGHFILGGGPEYIFGKEGGPSTLMYSLEAGISYNLLESLRLSGSLGGFRSVMSFHKEGRQAQTGNGPMVKLGASYIFRPNGRYISPAASVGAGYRVTIPPEKDVKTDGFFLEAGMGADINIGGLRLNISVKAAMTQALNPAAGISLSVLLP